LPLLTLLIAGAASFFVNAQAQESVPENAGDNPETAPIVIDMAAPLEPERAPPPPPEPSVLGVYRNYIQSMEASGGAFASGLTEQLLGLGLNLQALDRHAEAAAVLKRGVHVSRVQSGLYSKDQIPLLRGEIRSLTALQRFDEVDEHQRYLARVESEVLQGPALIDALLDQGAWAEKASQLKLGGQEARREHLRRAEGYYLEAWQLIKSAEAQSPAMIGPLEGWFRVLHQHALYQRETGPEGRPSQDKFRDRPEDRGVDPDLLRMALSRTYIKGEEILRYIYQLNLVAGSSAGEQASDLTRLGDWALWMNRPTQAHKYYEQAWNRITLVPPNTQKEPSPALGETEAPGGTGGDLSLASKAENDVIKAEHTVNPGDIKISNQDAPDKPSGETSVASQARAGDAESEPKVDGASQPLLATELGGPPVDDPVMRAALFESPSPLPDIDGIRALPPFRRDAAGPLVVQFRLNESGKITQLERLAVEPAEETEATSPDADTEEDEAVAQPTIKSDPTVDRLLRKMRKTRFRPRFEGGKPVATDMMVWSFDLNPTGS
jgi:hypothetical protein